MAAIDFPASPTSGQIFVAPNGVTYIWSATYTAWQAQSPLSSGFVGDFCATIGASPLLTTLYTIILFPTILSGNAGSWYNPATGRFTPPKGRYTVVATMAGNSTAGATQVQVKFRKNGVDIPNAVSVGSSTSANAWCNANISVTVDLNGTDYIDVQGASGSGGWSTQNGWFIAFPISPNANMVQSTGDFFATAFNLTVGGQATVLFPTVVTGNASGAYNPANGRWTPPAGRYYVWATVSSGAVGAASVVATYLRKNGTVIISGSQVPAGGGWWGDPAVAATLDMNGTDWIDIQASNSGAGGEVTNLFSWFGAFPLSGIKGPQGDVGPAGGTIDTGVVVDFAGSVAPTNWYLCDGSSKTTAGDPGLFSVIGYTYGGSGANFNVPDCRARVTVGMDPSAATGRVTSGVSGVAAQTLGAVGGDQNTQVHAHNLNLGPGPIGTAPGVTQANVQTITSGGMMQVYGSGNSQNMPPVIVLNKIIRR